MHPHHTVTAPAELLPFLFASWPEVTRTQMKQWLKHQAVTVNGRPVTRFDHPLAAGDVVALRTGKFASPKAELPGGLKIMFEDASVVVIDKPSGLVSMATTTPERTVETLLNQHYQRGHDRRTALVFPVHRLDRETSGLMLLARSPEAQADLLAQADRLELRFEAVCEGRLKADQGSFESHLDESLPFKVRSSPVAGPLTRHAVTHFRVLDRAPRLSLVELTLHSGRRHQIRVHLAEAGHPVVGDDKYGAATNPARRLALHAVALRFRHPVSGRELTLTSPLPRDLARLIPPAASAPQPQTKRPRPGRSRPTPP